MSSGDTGQCGICAEFNLYTQTHCRRCGEVLYWAFLIEPELYKPTPAPVASWLMRALDSIFNPSGKKPSCRYCFESITPETLVCPHCQRLLYIGERDRKSMASLGGYVYSTTFIDHEAPALRALIANYLKHHPDGT